MNNEWLRWSYLRPLGESLKGEFARIRLKSFCLSEGGNSYPNLTKTCFPYINSLSQKHTSSQICHLDHVHHIHTVNTSKMRLMWRKQIPSTCLHDVVTYKMLQIIFNQSWWAVLRRFIIYGTDFSPLTCNLFWKLFTLYEWHKNQGRNYLIREYSIMFRVN